MAKMKLVFRGDMLRLGIKEGSDKAFLRQFVESIQFHPAKCPRIIWGARRINFKVMNDKGWVALECKSSENTSGATVEKQGELCLPDNCLCVAGGSQLGDFEAVYEFDTGALSFDPERLKIVRQFVKIPIWECSLSEGVAKCGSFHKPLIVTDVVYDGKSIPGRLELGPDEEVWEDDAADGHGVNNVIKKTDQVCHTSEAWIVDDGMYEKVDEDCAVSFKVEKIGFRKLKVLLLFKAEFNAGFGDAISDITYSHRMSLKRAAHLKKLFEDAGAMVSIEWAKEAYSRTEGSREVVFVK